MECLYHLPEWAVYIETPGLTYERYPMYGFIAHLDYNLFSKNVDLQFAMFLEGREMPKTVALPCGEGGVQGAIIDHTGQDETHALRLVGDDALIGWITLQKDMEGRPDIGISLVKEHQNHGIGPEAVTLFANRLHSVYGLDRVHVRISALNPQCQKAFLKIGAVLDKAEPDYRLKKILDAFPEDARPNDPPPDMLFFHINLPINFKPGELNE